MDTAQAPFEDVVEHLATYTAPYALREGAGDRVRREVRAGIERWLRAGLLTLYPGDRLDPVACVNTMKTTGRSKTGDPLFEAYVATGRRLVLASDAANPGPASSWRVRWRRVVPAAALPTIRTTGGDDPVRVRLPLPLGRVHDPIVIESVVATRDLLRTRRVDGGIDVFLPRALDASDVTVTMTLRQGPRGEEPTDDATYLRERDGLSTRSAVVRALAARFADEPVEGAWRFLFEKLRSGSLRHETLDAGDPLGSMIEGGVFDCHAGAALLVAVCRACGLPARVDAGVALHPEAPFQHYWAEVKTGGVWRPFDVMSWDLAAGRIDDEEWSRRFYGRSGPRMVTQRMPDAVTGPPGYRAPPSWYVLARLTDRGVAQSLHEAATGALVCRDEIVVEGPLRPAGKTPDGPERKG